MKENKEKRGSLLKQAYHKLYSMLSPGRSRHKDKKTGEDVFWIYSYATYHKYRTIIKYFINYITLFHAEVTLLQDCRRFVPEWILFESARILSNGKRLSAWTIHNYAAAVNKLFGIHPGDPDYSPMPVRRRSDITRSRNDAVRDKHFSVSNNRKLIAFCCATGCRRNAVIKANKSDYYSRKMLEIIVEEYRSSKSLSPEDVSMYRMAREALDLFPDCVHFMLHRKDKGGRSRIAPIFGPDADTAVAIFMETALETKVWQHVSSNADIHSYRREYATMIYLHYARPICDIPYDRIHAGTGHRYQSEVYIMRGDQYGRRLDKAAMLKASKALGHNRIRVVADYYIDRDSTESDDYDDD